MLVLPDMHSPAAASEIAQKLLDALVQPYLIDGHPLLATPSIGVSVFPKDGNEVAPLISRADAAMYFAKQAGRKNFQMFDMAMLKPAG